VPDFKLGKLVNWLGVPSQFRSGSTVVGCHNAGNDAAYTMMALLIMAVNWEHIRSPGYGEKSEIVPEHGVKPERERESWLYRLGQIWQRMVS